MLNLNSFFGYFFVSKRGVAAFFLLLFPYCLFLYSLGKQEVFGIFGNVVFYDKFELKLTAIWGQITVATFIGGLTSFIVSRSSVIPAYSREPYQYPKGQPFQGRKHWYLVWFFLICINISVLFFSDRFDYSGASAQIYRLLAIIIFPSLVFGVWRKWAIVHFGIFANLSIFIFIFLHKSVSFYLHPDMYHSGEQLIPAFQVYSDGFGMFSSYIPSRGFSNYGPGFVSWLFGFENWELELQHVRHHYYSLVVSIVSFLLLVNMRFEMRVLTAVFFGLIGGYHIEGALCLFLCVAWFLSQQSLRGAQPFFFWAVILGPICVFFSVGEGALFLISVSILSLLKLFEYYGQAPRNEFCINLFFLSLIGMIWISILFFATPLLMPYLLEQSSVNIAAHGVHPIPKKEIVFLFFKYGFLIAIVAISLLLFGNSRKLTSSITIFGYPALFLFVAGGVRFLGRIDPGLSRPGKATLVAIVWVFLLLYLFFRGSKNSERNYHAYFLIGGLFLYPLLASQYVGNGKLNSFRLSSINFKGPKLQAYENSFNSPLWHKKNVINYLKRNDLESFTFLDLTGRNSIYPLLRKSPPVPTTSPYNSVTKSEQSRAIELLKQKDIIVRLYNNNIWHDGGGMFLRAPYLSNFLMKNYKILKSDDVEQDGVWVSKGPKEHDLHASRHLIRKFEPKKNLGGVPFVWGRFEEKESFVEAKKVDYLKHGNFNVNIPGSYESKLTLLRMQVIQTNQRDLKCHITFIGKSGQGSEFRSMKFQGRLEDNQEAIVVPLYGTPEWYIFPPKSLLVNCGDTPRINETSFSTLPQ